jgi:hypothetical protein
MFVSMLDMELNGWVNGEVTQHCLLDPDNFLTFAASARFTCHRLGAKAETSNNPHSGVIADYRRALLSRRPAARRALL